MSKNKTSTSATGTASSEGNGNKKKTLCPLTAEQFEKNATPVKVTIGTQTFQVNARTFESGSFGWYFGDKVRVTVMVDGKEVELVCQTGLVMTVVNSKDAPRS